MGPGVAERFDGPVDHRAPLTLDAEGSAAGDLAELACRQVVLSRSIENGGKFWGSDGYDRAGAAFIEEGVFGMIEVVVKMDGCAKSGRGKPRPYAGRERRETGFGEGDGETAVGDVVGGLQRAFGG
jgi:hypothetical protein